MKKMKNTMKKTGNAFCYLSIALAIATGLFFYLSLKEDRIQQKVHASIEKMDHEMERLIEKGLNHEELEKKQTGLFVFMNDTLVFWNQNDVNPKLVKRKVRIGHDTICHLFSGNYYIKSYESGAMTYYIFNMVNTSYPINNRYFTNKNKALPKYIEADISLIGSNEGKTLYNSSGKALAQYQITNKPKIKEPFRYMWPLPFLVLLIIGLILNTKRKSKSIIINNKKTYAIEIGIGAILLLSIIGTIIYDKTVSKRENEEMKRQAERLLEERDQEFEKSFTNFSQLILIDTNIREMLFAESNILADVILGYSKELLFDEVMKPYNTTLTLCSPEEEITIQPEGYITPCDKYFQDKLANTKHSKVGEGLYFMDYYTFDPNYLGIINITSKDSLQQKKLYYEFYKPITPESFGFPKLLKAGKGQETNDYSIANYRNNQLVYKNGKYIYPTLLNSLNVEDRTYTNSHKYKHYAIKQDDDSFLVISTPRKSWSEITAPFAVIFLGLAIAYLAIVWIIRPKERRKWQDRSFRQKLQTIILSTLGISFLAVGPVSVIFMRGLYNQKTKAAEFETTRTLALEMRNDLDFNNLLRTASKEKWDEILDHYAATFFTDLNLYKLNGQLLATTRPEIQDLNLQAPIMNAEAYQNIHRNKALFYTHEEQLGEGNYESAYIPITDDYGNNLAYLNTPYFSSATDLHNEIKNFVLTYLNIILALFGIALIFVLSITKRFTQPLSLIQNKLGDIKIDQKNEPIEWKGNDEIGALVKQYNQLIEELEKSAAELKRTTAESAWRGVARQVAHEIKNSLTPMRLSVQMLQRNIENGEATPEQIQRTTNTLIEQIDALSDIASSFSTYAKLPENHPQPLDLAELVGNVVNLYDNSENIKFNYIYDESTDHTFNGDKTNLNSAVSNLVKNAVQAIGTKPNGKIDVSLKSTANAFIISVKDNGKGIKDEDKGQIFLPNFTTKTGGSGVGLSLTYNIVQAAGGTIAFESKEGEGTEFIIELPKN